MREEWIQTIRSTPHLTSPESQGKPWGYNKGVGDAVFQFGFQEKRNTHVFRYWEDQERVLWREENPFY